MQRLPFALSLGYLRLLASIKGIRLESSCDGLDYSTSTGRLMGNILASVVEFEGQIMVERTKKERA